MKVSELPYKRVTIEEIKAVMDDVLARTRNAKSVDEILAAREDYLKLLCDYRTAESLSYMRYSINTVDEFYVAEKDYYDEIGPEAENYMVQYASTLLDSPFRAELEERLSPVLFKHLEVSRKSMSPEIIDDLVEENKLVSEYSKLMASLEFEFRGESLPRAMLMKYAKSDDRETRREAYEVLGKVLKEHSAELDDIYDRMVHVRDRMAKKMGYKNYVELGYHRMGRIDYDQDKVKTFRENVLNDIVPVVSRLRTENAKRLGIDDYKLYDNDVIIPGGDPVPAGGKAEIFAAAREMYHAMGEETGKFIDMMIDNDAFDVDSRKNKWGGGYCTEFPKYKQPFILANFNGTAGDVDVMTHEAGHALNAYLIADNRFALEIGCGGMDELFPVIAVVDPELMKTVPAKYTAYQGFDALFHATEGYIANVATPLSDAYALKSIELLAKYLPAAVKDGSDLEARTQVALASTLSGMVESTSCCTSEHGMEHALSAFYPKLPHGAGLIMLSEAYYSFFADKAPERFTAMAKAMGVVTGHLPEAERPMAFVKALVELQKEWPEDVRLRHYEGRHGQVRGQRAAHDGRAVRA